MSSYQITDIPKETWRAFRRICLEESISANRKLRELIEVEVAMADREIEGKKDNSTTRG